MGCHTRKSSLQLGKLPRVTWPLTLNLILKFELNLIHSHTLLKADWMLLTYTIEPTSSWRMIPNSLFKCIRYPPLRIKAILDIWIFLTALTWVPIAQWLQRWYIKPETLGLISCCSLFSTAVILPHLNIILFIKFVDSHIITPRPEGFVGWYTVLLWVFYGYVIET